MSMATRLSAKIICSGAANIFLPHNMPTTFFIGHQFGPAQEAPSRGAGCEYSLERKLRPPNPRFLSMRTSDDHRILYSIYERFLLIPSCWKWTLIRRQGSYKHPQTRMCAGWPRHV